MGDGSTMSKNMSDGLTIEINPNKDYESEYWNIQGWCTEPIKPFQGVFEVTGVIRVTEVTEVTITKTKDR